MWKPTPAAKTDVNTALKQCDFVDRLSAGPQKIQEQARCMRDMGFSPDFSSYHASNCYGDAPAACIVYWPQGLTKPQVVKPQDEEIVVKHFIDSIVGAKVIDSNGKKCVLDIGAGAGFPSLPLKFVRPDLAMVLLEPSEKRSSFLRYMIGSLDLQNMTVITAKLEGYVKRQDSVQAFEYIVVRFLKVDGWGAALAELLRPGGKVILSRAERVGGGVSLGNLALLKELEYELPSGYGHRVLSVFAK